MGPVKVFSRTKKKNIGIAFGSNVSRLVFEGLKIYSCGTMTFKTFSESGNAYIYYVIFL